MDELLKAKNLEFLELEKRFERAEEINLKNTGLIEKQQIQLTQMKDTIVSTQVFIEEKNDALNEKDAELAELDNTIKLLKDNLEEKNTIFIYRKKK